MNQFAILELFGHNRHVGLVSEVEMFGGKMGRCEALQQDGSTVDVFFTSASVYRLTPTTEAAAREMVKPRVYSALPYEEARFEVSEEGQEAAAEDLIDGEEPAQPVASTVAAEAPDDFNPFEGE